MIKQVKLDNKVIEYDLQVKKVKNINLRIKSDGSIHVSASKWISQKIIEDFLVSKTDFILKALKTFENKTNEPQHQYFDEDEICSVILELCEKVYPCFKKRGVKYPTIKFRRMVSQWGNCHSKKGILTFNTNLIYVPIECIEYVVVHEFTHFLQPDHSRKFYDEMSKIMSDWKVRRQKLKTISIR